MNAGASGSETSAALIEVACVNQQGEIEVLKRDQITFGYRFSSFQQRALAIVSAKFLLAPCQSARKVQLEITEYRKRTQPYSDKSAGCVFRNPESKSAGALIQHCGLKGKKLGGAEVSTLHGNFIVNKGGATAEHILELAREVASVVKEKTGIELEMELRRIPYRLED
jgi:UDP-N-acetylmuramate dehydrogenase